MTDIGTNHVTPHVLDVPLSDVLDGAEQTYTLSNSVDHDHDVTVTSADFAIIAAGGNVTKDSTVDSSSAFGTHGHEVTVTCTALS